MATRFPTFEDVLEAQTAVDEARAEVVALLEALATFLAPALTTVSEAFTVWQEKVEAYNEAVSDLRVDYEGCIEERSEKWQDSEKGQQMQAIADALDCGMMDATPNQTFTLDIEVGTICDMTYEDPEMVLPETPDLPEDPA
jgi:hypothetical protein